MHLALLTVLVTTGAAFGQNGSCRLTYDRFREIKTGMTLADVERALGCPGKEQVRSETPGTIVESWIWESGMSNVMVQLTNGKLTMKAQAGL